MKALPDYLDYDIITITAIDGMNDVYQWQRNKQQEDICQYYRVQIIAVSYLEGGN